MNPDVNQPTKTKVLIVEDDPMIQEMYATMFEIKGFDVVLANDGVEGLEKSITRPDIILLDIMMPRMNGLQMLDKLKQDATLKDIPVIMLSNLADESDIRNALAAGAVKYLVKSDYIPSQVAGIIEEVIAGLHKPAG